MNYPVENAGIVWYDLRETYLDPRIYLSQKKSIVGNFTFRLFSQDKKSESYVFPIKLLRSLFTNAAKIRTCSDVGEYDSRLLDRAVSLNTKLNDLMENCVDRIMFYVAEQDGSPESFHCVDVRIPEGMWAYPVAAIKELGFKVSTGEIFIRLYRQHDNLRQVYSRNPITCCWEKIAGVKAMSQLHLDHEPRMEDILIRCMPDLHAINKIADMNIAVTDLSAKSHRKHRMLWRKILPLLDDLMRDITEILSQYNLAVTLNTHNRLKG